MAFKPTVGYIADAFQGAFRQRLEQAQREREFNQRMNEEQRQSSLLEYWKQKNFQADEAYRKANIENQRIDNERQQAIAEANLGNQIADNIRQDEKDAYQKDKDKAQSLLDRARLQLSKDRLEFDKSKEATKNSTSNKMTSSIAKSIAEIKNPVNDKVDPYEQDNAFEKIKLEAFKNNGRAYNFVSNIINMYKRYPTPEELIKETQKHLQGGGISDKDAQDIDNFLNYYEQIQDKLKFPQQEKSKFLGIF